jgi:GTP pyrophosphokinase
LTSRFDDALVYASRIHRNQVRKGTGIPYLAHLLAVTALVLEDEGDEDQAIAALLHDAAEDQGGLRILEEIRQKFGDRVAEIVDGCTDTYENPKPAWRERKENYLTHLQTANSDVYRVSLADKLHNSRSILFDLRREGDLIWERFNGGKGGTLWYYRALLGVFQANYSSPMLDEFGRTVLEIESIVSEE